MHACVHARGFKDGRERVGRLCRHAGTLGRVVLELEPCRMRGGFRPLCAARALSCFVQIKKHGRPTPTKAAAPKRKRPAAAAGTWAGWSALCADLLPGCQAGEVVGAAICCLIRLHGPYRGAGGDDDDEESDDDDEFKQRASRPAAKKKAAPAKRQQQQRGASGSSPRPDSHLHSDDCCCPAR